MRSVCAASSLSTTSSSSGRRRPRSTLPLSVGLRLDLLVDGRLVVEVKAVERTLPLHKAQVITYLRIANKQLGLLLNFNVVQLKNGITRVIA